MTSLMRGALVALVILSCGSVLACEKHLNGHQTSSDTGSEAMGR